jgi:RNA polymerase sigma factor (sigma-70 family)
MEETATDAALIAASCRDPARFAAIFERHAEEIRRFLVRRVGTDEASALLGEVFRIAFERRVSYQSDRLNARPWLYGIASNLVLKHRRTVARRIQATGRLAAMPDWQEALADRVVEAVDAERLLPAVADAVASLPDADRQTLLLFAWEELSYDDIAQALDIPVGTVRSRLNRARRRIRELVGSDGKQPGEVSTRAIGQDTP